MSEKQALDPYQTGAVLQFLARHADIHYDRSAISLAVRLSYAEADAALDQLVGWSIVDARQATIGVRVFGLTPPDQRPPTAVGLALVVDPQPESGRDTVACLADGGWNAVAVADLSKAGFILSEAAPAFALVDSFAAEGLIPWNQFAVLGLPAGGVPVLLRTSRQEVDVSLAGQHGFSGILSKSLECAALVDAVGRFRDAAAVGI